MSTLSWTRRSFLMAGAAAAATAHAAPASGRKKIALIATVMFKNSHAMHFVDRLAMGYVWAGQWLPPRTDLVSLYVAQFPETDLARGRSERYHIPIYSSIADALTLGTGKLAVDGVVLIGEHGDYPENEKGQTLYPRYEFFKEIVKVFEASGRSVPVFNDKHLSTEWSKCTEMVADAKRLGFPFLAGSSLPVTRRLPAVDIPWGTPLSESVAVGYGGIEKYDYHGLETAQCMSERRRGGEAGVKSVLALRGEKMWEHAATRKNTQRLLAAALSRSHTWPVEGYPLEPVSFGWARKVFPDAFAYFIEHRDGFHTTLFMLPVRDFNYAGLNSETGQITSCQMFLPMPGSSSTTADFFNPLIHHIEDMILENRAPYPVERTLLTSGVLIAAVESLYRKGEVIQTPELDVKYTVPKESLYWRE
ncbi:hypothetical protein [Prosthecobacter fluviatilis]|uniref:Uncharacterized protein n=1 Tax=Prosthecobacter fluviatilis TaxID=445931 RepID=A0ABW0KRF3_9BACT